MKTYYLFLAFTISCNLVNAQQYKLLPIADSSIAESVNKNGSVRFKQNQLLKISDLIGKYKSKLGLSENDNLKLSKREISESGLIHYRYKQYHNEIEIENADFIIHGKNENAISSDGLLYKIGKTVPSESSISKETAIQSALSDCKATLYFWQDVVREEKVQKKGKSYYPNPELCYYKTNDGELTLCYKMYVFASVPHKRLQYFVNAQTAKVERISNMSIECFDTKPHAHKKVTEVSCMTMFVTTANDGVRTIFGKYDDTKLGAPYSMADNCNSSEISVMDDGTYIYRNASSNWDIPWDGTSTLNRGKAMLAWGLQRSNIFFFNRFGRTDYGMNANGADLDAHFPALIAESPFNASYNYDPIGNDDTYFGIGYGDNLTDYFISPDIVAHEYTHGITKYRSALTYQGESGALNESYSDIFGEAVERFIRGYCDFKNSYEINFLWRSLENPQNTGQNSFNKPGFTQPDRYNGFSWASTAEDAPDVGGVHTNSGVQNFMFYLLVNGGNGYTNSGTAHAALNQGLGYPYSVQGLGFDKAIAIAYQSQNYLTSNANYANARDAWVQAASNLYGACSFEAIQTGKAWNAVGLHPTGTSYEQICTTNPILLPPYFYVLGSYAYTLLSASYMIVGGTPCTADVSPTGNLVTLKAQGEITFKDGFSAPEGSNLIANNDIDDCVYASY